MGSWDPSEEGGVVRVRPPCPELTTSALGEYGITCCHIAFSQCGRFASVCFANGFAEVVHFPALTRAVIIQNLDNAVSIPRQVPGLPRTLDAHLGNVLCTKSAFAWHPVEEQRAYDQN